MELGSILEAPAPEVDEMTSMRQATGPPRQGAGVGVGMFFGIFWLINNSLWA